MSNKFIVWVALGVGVILLYAAYKGKSPKDIISSVTNAPSN